MAQQVQALLAELSIDWEEVLARLLGDVPAHQLGRLARAAGNWVQTFRRKFERDTADYLLHEQGLIAGRHEVEDLGRAIFTLSNDVDRAEVRLRRLRERRLR